jgi:hypothetical protein
MPRKRHKPEEIVAKLGRSWAVRSTACRRASRSVLLEIVGHLNRQNRPTRPRLSMPARCRLDRGKLPIPVSIGRADTPDSHRYREVIDCRKRQSFELQLRSLRFRGFDHD